MNISNGCCQALRLGQVAQNITSKYIWCLFIRRSKYNNTLLCFLFSWMPATHFVNHERLYRQIKRCLLDVPNDNNKINWLFNIKSNAWNIHFYQKQWPYDIHYWHLKIYVQKTIDWWLCAFILYSKMIK